MEAVAAAASLAGLITLVGQGLKGVVQLKEFFSNCSSTQLSAAHLGREVDSLHSVLKDVAEFLSKAPKECQDLCVGSLETQVSECSKDVSKWLEFISPRRDHSTEEGRISFYHRFRSVFNHKKIQESPSGKRLQPLRATF